MAELLPQLAGAGGLGALAVVIIYLLGSNRADRKATIETTDAANRRANEAEERARVLRVELDEAHKARRAAENEAAALARQLESGPYDPTGGLP